MSLIAIVRKWCLSDLDAYLPSHPHPHAIPESPYHSHSFAVGYPNLQLALVKPAFKAVLERRGRAFERFGVVADLAILVRIWPGMSKEAGFCLPILERRFSLPTIACRPSPTFARWRIAAWLGAELNWATSATGDRAGRSQDGSGWEPRK